MRFRFLVFLVLFGGCSDETRLASPPPVDTPATAFPISIPDGERYLVDADSNPFMIHGEAAWSLISGARREEVQTYLQDRKSRGFNTIVVVLIDHTDPLVNAYGDAPFHADGDFSTPNEAYFSHADWVIEQAAAAGFLVWLSPIYLGYEGGDEGFYTDVIAAGPDAMRAWGRWVGERYRDTEGLVWLMGGDYVPPPAGLALLNEVVTGIAERDDEHYFAAHWARETSGWEVDVDWLDLNTTYSEPPMYLKSLADRDGMDAPMVMFEGLYENEYGITLPQLRAQAYESMLAGSTGHFFGNWPIWKFADGWQGALGSDGSISMTHLRNLLLDLPWWTLVPDTSGDFITGGRGSYGNADYVSLARSDSMAVAYLPSVRSLTMDVSDMASPVQVRWFDPTNGTFTDGGMHTGEARVPSPGTNAAGQADWVLLVEAAR